MTQKKLFLVVCLLYSTLSFGQFTPGKTVDEPITLSNGVKVKKGDTLHLGQGSNANKNFLYIYNTKRETAANSLAGSIMIVDKIKVEKDKKFGDTYYLIIDAGFLKKYIVDIKNAAEYGEVVGINRISLKKEPITTSPKAGTSLADELKKLKELYDQGAITKEEYESAKKKLLNQ